MIFTPERLERVSDLYDRTRNFEFSDLVTKAIAHLIQKYGKSVLDELYNRSKFADKARTPYYMKRYENYVKEVPLILQHEHIGGGVEPDWAWHLLKEMYGTVEFTPRGANSPLVFATPEEIKRYAQAPVKSLSEYLDHYDVSRAIFNRLENTDAIIDHIVGKHVRGGVKRLELRTALKSIDVKKGEIGYTALEEIDALSSAIKKAREKYGIQVALILCVRRGNTLEHSRVAERTVRMAGDALSDGVVVGVDLAGKEVGNPPIMFREQFLLAKYLGLGTTMHAGEAVANNYVHQAMIWCQVDRVGHGVGIERGSKAYNHAIVSGTALEICPKSNFNTSALRTDPSTGLEIPISRKNDHPVIYFERGGLTVTINTDNSGVSNTTMWEEFLFLNQVFGLHRGDARRFIINSIRTSFATFEEKEDLLAQLREADDEFSRKDTASSVPSEFRDIVEEEMKMAA